METTIGERKHVSPYLILFIVSLGMLMTSLDSTIVNVAISKLQVAMGATTDAVQWVITAYLLAMVIGLPAAGWVADNFGYKFTFRLALALFTIGSLLCSLSGNLVTLVMSRVFQGFAAGLLSPLGSAFLLRVFPREKLGLAIALFSISAVVSTSFGPTLGGLLIDNFSWQTMFLINIPVGIVAILLGTLFLPEYKKDERSPFDFPSFFAVGLALAFLLFALSNGNAAWNTDGWTSSLIIACFCLALGGSVLFGIFQNTTNHPLIDLSLFKSYSFSLCHFRPIRFWIWPLWELIFCCHSIFNWFRLHSDPNRLDLHSLRHRDDDYQYRRRKADRQYRA